MRTDSNREYFRTDGLLLHMNVLGKQIVDKQTAATSTALFQGKKKDPVSLYWNDY